MTSWLLILLLSFSIATAITHSPHVGIIVTILLTALAISIGVIIKLARMKT